MTYSNRGGYGGNRSQNFSRGGFNSRGSDRSVMYDAVCAKCGVDCQVPFRPNGRKDVFCSKCFETNGGESRGFSNFRDQRDSRGPRRFEKRDGVSTYFADKQMFSATCDECGDNCQVPFRPSGDKPVLCSNCFANKNEGGRNSGRQSDYVSRPAKDNGVDLDVINAKLDKIIKLLSPKEIDVVEKVEVAKDSKQLTEKILDEIQAGKEITGTIKGKKKTKTTSKKKIK